MAEIHTPAQTIGRRYILETKLGQGGMGTVYRAYDRLTSQRVALKLVTLEKENLQFATRATSLNVEVALAREFKTLASLRHPHIISVLDYGFDEQVRPYFTMELLEDAQDILEAGALQSEDQQVQLLIQVLQALAYLHRRGIVHRDLKPDNVMVLNGQVKVLDFGLAIAQEYLKASDDVVAGTLAYMAPEVLQGQPASVASDLYAVGIIAYELFAETYPFEFDDVSKLLHDIMSTSPDVASLGLDPLLENVLTRLLSKDPSERFNDARELIRIYAEATNQQLKYETDTIRESFLQAARFVGREREMTLLTEALQTAQEGHSSTWLIAGESGVGKSRLMDELRTQALVQGMLAVRGNAVSDGGTPYQIWREPLRRLVLEPDLSEVEAAVLKPLIPDISRLLDRPVHDAPELEPQAAQDRLISTVEMLLRRQHQPLALFLEDLHWAGSESLLMLDRISRMNGLPLLIVGNYRDDEAAGIPDLLPSARSVKLQRLGEESIQKLSESMLGEAGRRREVIDLLRRETEGNVLFIVEVVRTLAEEAGDLDLVGAASLPDSVFVGGMHKFIKRRLDRISAEAFPLLQMAAVIGRQIDLALLTALDANLVVTPWLSSCADAAVLEVQDDRWRFTHDSFREALLNDLTTEKRESLHRQVAEAIEAIYQDSLPTYYARLAHHWSQARIVPKALEYLEKAGEQALKNFANQEALTFIQDALRLAAESQVTVTPARRARWLRQIGQAYWGLGNLAALREHVEDALRLHNQPIPDSGSNLGLALSKQIAAQIGHRLRAPAQVRHNQDEILEMVRAYKLLGQAYFFQNEANLTLYVTLQQLNLSERIAPSPELAEAYVNMCLVAGLVPLHSMARTYEKRGIAVAESLSDTYIIGQVSSVISLYYLGLGQWDTARRYIERSTAVADQIGDRRLWESVTGVLALVNAFEGRFKDAITIFTEVYHSSRHSGNTQTYLWGMLGQAENLLPAGRFDEAEVFLNEAHAVPIEKFGRDSEIRSSALMALTAFYQGRTEQALTAAATAFDLITQSPPTSSWLLQHYAAVAEIYLALWESGAQSPGYAAGEFERRARAAVKILRQFARTFPIGQPRAARSQGLLEQLEGHPQKARHTWETGLAAARTLRMPYDEALLLFEIGRRNQSQADYLRRALGQFTQLEADYDAQRVRAILETS
ncbi:MAG: DUF2791 family P-loop domain-containing protein [Anaerolineae bacterium]|nr:DUF2791 family P-loop domain-containing protein [Anaerolineae bacterium]